MTEIYFKINLPKDAKRPEYLQVDKDGFVCRILDTMVNPLFSLQVIGDSVLPPHGRLIDAHALAKKIAEAMRGLLK